MSDVISLREITSDGTLDESFCFGIGRVYEKAQILATLTESQ